MKILILSLSLLLSPDLSQMFEVIKQVETNGDTYAIGDQGKAFGIVQIHKACVEDVNRIYGTNYTHYDMFDERCAKEVFTLYINAGILRYIKKYGRRPSEGEIVRMWNGGYYKGYKYSSTIKYLKRYNKFKILQNGKTK